MAEENRSLSPRETAIRMLEHANEGMSYEDIIRQLRILQQIDWVMNDAEMVGLPTGWSNREPVPESDHRDPGSENDHGEPVPENDYREPVSENDHRPRLSFTADVPPVTLESRRLYSWRSLAERSDELPGSFLDRGDWIY